MTGLRTIVAGLLLLAGSARLAAQVTADFAFGRGAFISRTDVQSQVTFSETPQVTVVSGHPGGDGEGFYYDSFVYSGGVEFHPLTWNTNVPGQRRLSDMPHDGQFEFYNVNSGNLLVPGLGIRLHGSGVMINFTELSSPINAFGVNFGSVQETSPCCVVQLFSLELSNGEVRDFFFSSGNYGGRETELSHSTFTGFHVNGAFIQRVQIEQLGHSPVLDNLMWGTTKPVAAPPPAQGRLHIIINVVNPPPGQQPPPSERIELVDPNDATIRKLIADMKPKERDVIEAAQNVAGPAEIVSNLPFSNLVTFYSKALAEFVRNDIRILEHYANDPPRFDYDVVAEYESSETNAGFVDQFGSGFELIDETWLLWVYAVKNLELGLTTLERLQGAVIDGNTAAMTRQAEALVFFFAEADYSLEAVSQNLDDVLTLLKNAGIADFEISGSGTPPTTFYGLNALAAKNISDSRMIAILRSDRIFNDGFESGSIAAWPLASP